MGLLGNSGPHAITLKGHSLDPIYGGPVLWNDPCDPSLHTLHYAGSSFSH